MEFLLFYRLVEETRVMFPEVEKKFNFAKSHYSGITRSQLNSILNFFLFYFPCNILRFLIYLPRTIDTISVLDVCREERQKVSEEIRAPLFHGDFIIYSFCHERVAAFLSNANFSIRVVRDFHDRVIDGNVSVAQV